MNESFTTLSKFKNIDKTLPVVICNNANEKTTSIELKHVCIKGSMNTAYFDNKISVEAVQYILTRGCRFIDFELFYLPTTSYGENPNYDVMVGFSNEPTNNQSIPSPISLNDILRTTISTALIQNSFADFEVNNINDPLFIQFRFNVGKDVQPEFNMRFNDVLKNIYEDVQYKPYFYLDPITGETKIRDIQKRVLFIVENKTPIHTYTKTRFINCISNTQTLTKYSYKTLENKISDVSLKPQIVRDVFTNSTQWKVAGIDPTIKRNPDPYTSYMDYGIHILPMRYYSIDEPLIQNETIFGGYYREAIIPLAYVITYCENYPITNSNSGVI